MTGNELRALRKRTGLGRAAFAWEIGYRRANENTARRMITRAEACHDRDIDPTLAYRASMRFPLIDSNLFPGNHRPDN